jgi:hypothetical protein
MMCWLLSSPVIAAAVAGASGLGAVVLGLWRYRSERWWERKATAYANIIEALHTIEDVHNQWIEAIEKTVQLPGERLEKLRIADRDAHAEIRKYANQGGFVITTRAADALDEFSKILGEGPGSRDKYEYYNDRAVAASTALATVKQEASADLKT